MRILCLELRTKICPLHRGRYDFFCKSRNNLVNNSSQAWTDICAWLLFIVCKNVRTTLLRNRMSGGVWIGNKSIYPISDIDKKVIVMYD